MTSPDDPLSLLTILKERFGVVESCSPFGPAVIVPNSEYEPGWTDLLNKAGFKAFCGEEAGRVVWVIPVKTRLTPAGSNPGRGCITGRPWTKQEDEQLLAVLSQDKSAAEIASLLASKLDRTERAVKSRVLKLRRQGRQGSGPTPPEETRLEASSPCEGPPEQQAGSRQIRSLLQSALLLSEDPRHKPALKLILEACTRLATANQGES